jgi:hypothetical protein
MQESFFGWPRLAGIRPRGRSLDPLTKTPRVHRGELARAAAADLLNRHFADHQPSPGCLFPISQQSPPQNPPAGSAELTWANSTLPIALRNAGIPP